MHADKWHLIFKFLTFATTSSSICQRGCDCLQGPGGFLWIHPGTRPPRQRATLENASQISPAVCLICLPEPDALSLTVFVINCLRYYQRSIHTFHFNALKNSMRWLRLQKSKHFRWWAELLCKLIPVVSQVGGFNTLNNAKMNLWGFYVALFLYFCLCSVWATAVICLCIGLHHTKKTEPSFCPISCHRCALTWDQIRLCSLSAAACQQLIIAERITLVVFKDCMMCVVIS